eukprot:31583-Alexandrium_andersonii.AAC.1
MARSILLLTIFQLLGVCARVGVSQRLPPVITLGAPSAALAAPPCMYHSITPRRGPHAGVAAAALG